MICVGALPDLSNALSNGECKIIEVKHHASRYHSKAFGVGISCKTGELIRGYVAFWGAGRFQDYVCDIGRGAWAAGGM
jgi:hypothetical protein